MTKIVSLHQLCEMLGISRTTYYHYSDPQSPRYIENFPKRLPGYGHIKFRESDIEAYIASLHS